MNNAHLVGFGVTDPEGGLDRVKGSHIGQWHLRKDWIQFRIDLRFEQG
jgi:hypothetical protein